MKQKTRKLGERANVRERHCSQIHDVYLAWHNNSTHIFSSSSSSLLQFTLVTAEKHVVNTVKCRRPIAYTNSAPEFIKCIKNSQQSGRANVKRKKKLPIEFLRSSTCPIFCCEDFSVDFRVFHSLPDISSNPKVFITFPISSKLYACICDTNVYVDSDCVQLIVSVDCILCMQVCVYDHEM